VNGQPPAANWTGLYAPGERVRLRFINAAAMTYFDVRIPGLELTVIAADGQPVEPVSIEEFRIAPAETYDVIVTPAGGAAYTIFAQSGDRSGYARATLAPRPGMTAAVPPLDPAPILTMADMGHGGEHAGHGAESTAGEHAGHGSPAGGDEHAGHAGHAGMAASASAGASGIAVLPDGVRHAPAEFGPAVDMRVDQPQVRLDDPGVGLRDNGRRVLTYAALRSAFPDPVGRTPGRTVELHLTGHMGRYQWSFNGVRASEAPVIQLELGERLRLVLVNDTMMEHPIHLHGLWSDLENAAGEFQLRKHTLSVRPGQALSCRVLADAPGRWAMHCHLAMHMETGMFREVRVSGGPAHG
jgi:CopA family copper-resistance protein